MSDRDPPPLPGDTTPIAGLGEALEAEAEERDRLAKGSLRAEGDFLCADAAAGGAGEKLSRSVASLAFLPWSDALEGAAAAAAGLAATELPQSSKSSTMELDAAAPFEEEESMSKFQSSSEAEADADADPGAAGGGDTDARIDLRVLSFLASEGLRPALAPLVLVERDSTVGASLSESPSPAPPPALKSEKKSSLSKLAPPPVLVGEAETAASTDVEELTLVVVLLP